MLSKQEQQKEKESFFKSLDTWLQDSNKKDWDNMFQIIYRVSVSLFKKRAKGIRLPNLEERAMDATIYSMDLIRRGKYPTSGLIAWCDSQVKGEAYSEKNKRVDREYSYEALLSEKILNNIENGYYTIGEIETYE